MHARPLPLLLLTLTACPQDKTGGAETGQSAQETAETAEPDPCVGEGEDAEKRAVACAMVEAATTFLASLSAEQLALAQYAMDDSERMDWDNRPHPSYPRQGLAFEDLSEDQLTLAYALLETGLSATGYARARNIIAIDEQALLDGDTMMGERYYHINLFDTPSMDAAWGLQLDGHHLAINWTLSGAEVVMTPTFYGVRPTTVPEGDLAGLRALAELEDRAFTFLDSLDEEQLTLAVASATAPSDLSVGPHMDGIFPEETIGLQASALSVDQQALLLDLVDAYVGNMPRPQGEAYLAEVGAALDETWFAWMGPTDGSSFYYYRVSGPTVWLEYDVIASMDHAHAVWRDPLDDYGAFTLASHYAAVDHGVAPW